MSEKFKRQIYGINQEKKDTKGENAQSQCYDEFLSKDQKNKKHKRTRRRNTHTLRIQYVLRQKREREKNTLICEYV